MNQIKEYTVIGEISGSAQMDEFLCAYGAIVPSREDRTNQDREDFGFNCFLKWWNKTNRDFPIKLFCAMKSGASPDFLIALEKKVVGVEITEVTGTRTQQVLSATREHSGEIIDLYSATRPTGPINDSILTPGQRLTSRGWEGAEVEEEFADLCISAIARKEGKLAGYCRCDEQYLVLMDNSCLPMVDHTQSLALIQERIASRQASSEFDAILLFHNSGIFICEMPSVKA